MIKERCSTRPNDAQISELERSSTPPGEDPLPAVKAWFGQRMSDGLRWFGRVHDGRLSGRAAERFLLWLSRHPEHGREVARREVIWDRLGQLREDPEMRALVRETLARTQGFQAQVSWYRSSLLVATFAAATLAALGIGEREDAISSVSQPAFAHTYATDIGEQSTVVLPEGSHLVLNTATRVSVTLTEQDRTVVLEHGEATFTVTPDPARPFQVIAGGAVARVLGTSFDVRRFGERTDVAVLHGQVQVTSRAESEQQQRLTAGTAVTYQDHKLGEVVEADLRRIAAWQARRIDFNDISLASAVEEFNRYSTTPVLIGDPSLLDVRVSGGLRFGDVDAFTRTLNSAFGIESERTPEGVRLIVPASGDKSTQHRRCASQAADPSKNGKGKVCRKT